MKRLLIGSCVAALLMGAAPAMADQPRGKGHAGSPPYAEHAPGHQKKPFLQAHYRRDHYDRDRGHKHKHRSHKRHRDHYSRYDHGHHHRDKHRHSHQRDRYDRYDRYDRHHSHREYRVHIGFDGYVPPEYRVARIIHNTRELIEPSRR